MRIALIGAAPMLVGSILPAIAGCTQRISPDWLWLPANAMTQTNAVSLGRSRAMYRDGSADVVFTISDPGPREQVSRQFMEHFEREGWRRRERQYLNPHIATSFATGWRLGNGGVQPTDAEGRLFRREVHL